MMNWSIGAIQEFSNTIEIAPGIIVGRLQHHENEVAPAARAHNALKARFR